MLATTKMKPRVFILATCRKPELAPMTELVFQTLRVGFPTANVSVFINGNSLDHCPNLKYRAASEGCVVAEYDPTIHHEWIEELIESEHEPFFILDTDVIFYDSFEQFDFSESALAGWRMPEFEDEFTGTITRSRLHGSLLYIDPDKVIKAANDYSKNLLHDNPFTPQANLIHPLVIPFNGRAYFYDTMGLMYHAIGGTPFTDKQKDAYFHFHYGTLSDMVLPRLTNAEAIAKDRQNILEHPELGRGGWRHQELGLACKVPQFFGEKIVLSPTGVKDAKIGHDWNVEVCKGDPEAMNFSSLWYNYVHGIDDLIDTMKDGRPVMSKEQIISLFFMAAMLYNHPYYRKHQHMLFPIILDVTNIYKMSVGWEASPRPHLRVMADVLRSCGLKMHTMIALIQGGEDHQIDITRRVYERDWLNQHAGNGYPI